MHYIGMCIGLCSIKTFTAEHVEVFEQSPLDQHLNSGNQENGALRYKHIAKQRSIITAGNLGAIHTTCLSRWKGALTKETRMITEKKNNLSTFPRLKLGIWNDVLLGYKQMSKQSHKNVR